MIRIIRYESFDRVRDVPSSVRGLPPLVRFALVNNWFASLPAGYVFSSEIEVFLIRTVGTSDFFEPKDFYQKV